MLVAEPTSHNSEKDTGDYVLPADSRGPANEYPSHCARVQSPIPARMATFTHNHRVRTGDQRAHGHKMAVSCPLLRCRQKQPLRSGE